MVSVIIPAYNAEQYIKKCLVSLQAQTFQEHEIIIIDDGSKDATGEICLEEAKKDNRIVYIRTENHGQGHARNVGIKAAKYDYVTFVDSDDWVSDRYIEVLYNNLVNHQVDISICNKCSVETEGEKITKQTHIRQWVNAEQVLEVKKDKDLIWKVKYSLWAKMFKKSLFLENEIWQPDHKFENNTVIPSLVAHAEKIYMSKEYLYYYWINRSGSTVNSLSSYKSMILCLKKVVERFQADGLYMDYKDALFNFCMDNIRHTMVMCTGALKNGMADSYYALEEELTDFMKKQFDTVISTEKNVLVWGSYNLKKMVDNAVVFPEKIQNYYSFSNIESMLFEATDCAVPEHKNKYRAGMIRKDIEKTFCNPDDTIRYLILDLLEERFGCINFQGTKITCSNALAELEGFEEVALNNFNKELYAEQCKKFLKIVKRCYPNAKIVLVKNYLATEYGDLDSCNTFEELGEIEKVNNYLEKCYTVFENVVEDMTRFENEEFVFTDKLFAHGCSPEHSNDWNYICMGNRIGQTLKIVDRKG